MIRYAFTVAGLAATRFAYSPLLELRNALRVLHPLSRSNHPIYRDWRTATLSTIAASGLDLTPLYALTPPSGYTPDFLAPPPGPAPTIDAELARVRATPTDRVATELTLLEQRLSPGAGSQRRATVRSLRANPSDVRDRTADLLRECWDVLLDPLWPRVRAVLDADVEARARLLAREGAAVAFGKLAAGIRWRQGGLDVRRPFAEHVEVADLGLVLLPSVFAGRRLGGTTDQPWQPSIWFPAYGIAAVWQRAPETNDSLIGALGATRTRILAALARPATTTALAHELGRAAGNVSTHLAALREANLVTSSRAGRRVLYARTPLAEQLLAAAIT